MLFTSHTVYGQTNIEVNRKAQSVNCEVGCCFLLVNHSSHSLEETGTCIITIHISQYNTHMHHSNVSACRVQAQISCTYTSSNLLLCIGAIKTAYITSLCSLFTCTTNHGYQTYTHIRHTGTCTIPTC